MKAILLGLATAQFDWSVERLKRVGRLLLVFVGVVLLCSFANVVAPGPWNRLFSVNGSPIVRYGLSSLIGPFIHPFDLAFAASMAAVAFFTFSQAIGRVRFSAVAILVLTFVTFLTFRRKDLLGLLTSLYFTAILYGRRRLIVVGSFVVIAGALIALPEIVDQAQLISDALDPGNRAARTVLFVGGVRLANEYAPLGAGFGRFASRTAAAIYSPEYYNLGFSTVYGLGPGGAFLTDVSWPALLGETGWFGAVAYVGGLMCIVLMFVRAFRQRSSQVRQFLGVTGLSWTILLIFESTGAAVFTSPPVYGFLFALAGFTTGFSSSSASSRVQEVVEGRIS